MAAERAVGAVSEPSYLTGKPSNNFIDAPWVCTHASTPGADTISAIVSAGKGPQETSDWKSEIRTWGGAGADGSAELLASQAPQEEDDDDLDKVEDEEEPQEEDDDDDDLGGGRLFVLHLGGERRGVRHRGVNACARISE